MARIVVSDNVSLDGVVQDPAGDEGFARGGWVGLLKDRPELSEIALEEAWGAEALLLGFGGGLSHRLRPCAGRWGRS